MIAFSAGATALFVVMALGSHIRRNHINAAPAWFFAVVFAGVTVAMATGSGGPS